MQILPGGPLFCLYIAYELYFLRRNFLVVAWGTWLFKLISLNLPSQNTVLLLAVLYRYLSRLSRVLPPIPVKLLSFVHLPVCHSFTRCLVTHITLNTFSLHQLRIRKQKCYFHFIVFFSHVLYVNPGFWPVSFSFCLKDLTFLAEHVCWW